MGNESAEFDLDSEPESNRMVMKSEHGAVWHVRETGHFWIQFGNVRWQMDVEALSAYRNYLRTVTTFVSGHKNPKQPIYLRTRDPAICLAFKEPQLRELAYLLDASETIFSIERTSA
jgi:hypothetical protein